MNQSLLWSHFISCFENKEMTAYPWSFIAVTMNSRDWYEIIGLSKISPFIKQPCRNFCLESVINGSKFLEQCSTLAKQSRKLNLLICSELLKFQASSKFRLPASQPASPPAVRLVSARCKLPDFSKFMYSRVRFMNFSICWRFVHFTI